MRALTLSPGSVVVSADSMAPGTTTPSAIILAAGEGRRLGGRAKASLRIDGSSLLQRLGSALRAAGVHELGVVIGPYRDQLLPLARACDAQVLQHPQAGATLIDSQRLALDHHLAQQGDADLLLVLADLPFLTATHIEALLERWLAAAGRGDPRSTPSRGPSRRPHDRSCRVRSSTRGDPAWPTPPPTGTRPTSTAPAAR